MFLLDILFHRMSAMVFTPVDVAEMVVGDRVDFFAKVQEALPCYTYQPSAC